MAREKITLYEKPSCTTCRIVKKMLNEKSVDYEAINYFEQPLTADDLKKLLKSSGLKPAECLRTKEEAYKKFVAGKELTDDQLIHVMVEHPDLIQRPIVVKGNKAVLARPTERLAELGL